MVLRYTVIFFKVLSPSWGIYLKKRGLEQIRLQVSIHNCLRNLPLSWVGKDCKKTEVIDFWLHYHTVWFYDILNSCLEWLACIVCLFGIRKNIYIILYELSSSEGMCLSPLQAFLLCDVQTFSGKLPWQEKLHLSSPFLSMQRVSYCLWEVGALVSSCNQQCDRWLILTVVV